MWLCKILRSHIHCSTCYSVGSAFNSSQYIRCVWKGTGWPLACSCGIPKILLMIAVRFLGVSQINSCHSPRRSSADQAHNQSLLLSPSACISSCTSPATSFSTIMEKRLYSVGSMFTLFSFQSAPPCQPSPLTAFLTIETHKGEALIPSVLGLLLWFSTA